jgi:hypothetical protein
VISPSRNLQVGSYTLLVQVLLVIPWLIPTKEVPMNPHLKWLIRTGITAISLISLIETGRRNGWL